MDRISLTWDAALADPPAAAALLRGLEEQAEAYIVRSRTLRQWLENVPPFSAMGTFLPTTAPDDDAHPTDADDGTAPDGRSSRARSDEGPAGAPASAGPEDADDTSAQSAAPAGGPEAGSSEAPDGERDGESTGFVPPPRAPTGGQDPTPPPPQEESADGRKKRPTGAEPLTLYERVEAVLESFRPGAPLTVRSVALEIGHQNLRSLRPVLDRMAEQRLLVKTELHPRAVVYHRPESAGSPAREATMF
ncbi:hypothetical protein J7F02_30025 [Streptomyces sp. ISL-112]|uniref:hypothetical protein n=1 Tax=unclassified Streptomyces TaxID=2593676 RepID=UPI001BEB09EF|nr:MULTISPECIES: hypothetical protein [unclassified Streptomyces]MBT2429723.1 hypothetical protein [Streptomyces sp. ISL-112]MBT2464840.1 hypothetical protein [Streptomyces sp. ISL-63]